MTGLPPTSIVPPSGSSKPPIIRSVVVLPQPDGPSSAKNDPEGISSVRSSTATTSSNFFVTCARRTSRGVVIESFRGYHESLTATCLMRVYSSIEYSDISLP